MPALSAVALSISGLLFASVWQGLLIAAIVVLGLRALPKLGAATRYAIWLCALVALVLIPVVSSVLPSMHRSTPAIETTTVEVHSDQANLPALPPIESVLPSVQTTTPDKRITIPESLGIAVALMWVLLAGARGLMLAFNLREIAAIRRNARLWSDAGTYPVLLSDRVAVPIAIGFVHPAIVLPTALIDEQGSDAVDAIIMHETAHLRRNDVYTNAFARILEALLAFNPVAWYVLRKLSVEREIACDDWVVNQCGNGDIFARALATMASCAGARAPIAAPSAIGSRHAVVARIEHLLEKHPRRLRLSLSALGGTLMLLAIIAIVLQSISPVLAYAPQTPVTVVAASGCATPNRGLMTRSMRFTNSGPVYGPYIPVPTQATAAPGPGGSLVLIDVSVDASGVARKATLISGSGYGDVDKNLVQMLLRAKYEPAIANCVAVASTTRATVGVSIMPPTVYSFVAPAYPNGWSDQHPSSCKVPPLIHDGAPVLPSTVALPQHGKLVAAVDIHVDASGVATGASLVKSSGQAVYDDAVLAAARAATYPLNWKTGFQAVRPSGASLKWNETHGYDAFSKCSPLPTDYVWTATYKSKDQSHLAGAGP